MKQCCVLTLEAQSSYQPVLSALPLACGKVTLQRLDDLQESHHRKVRLASSPTDESSIYTSFNLDVIIFRYLDIVFAFVWCLWLLTQR